ncbi:hypothetical protein [Microbacterium sp. NPDC089696]|uniref:hypothetical protein n=1 Tax=Microbacterium sp. NPDC089696 TaxID=3364199 RepID=UPI00381D7A28
MSEQQPPGQPQGTPPMPPSHPGQQYAGQQYPGQQYPGQQYPGQQYPGQPYAGQPQQGQAQYPAPHAQGAPQYASGPPSAPGYPAAPGSPTAPASGGALGRVAFVVALASLAVGLLVTLTFPLLVRSVGYSTTAIGAVTSIGNGLVFVISIAAIVLGLMAVRRPKQQIFAGIAIGIAGSEIIGLLVSWASNAVLALQYL